MPVVTFSPDKDTVRSLTTSGGSGQGCGKSKHLYIGRQGSRDYDSYIRFPIDFTGNNMATITAATLDIYTDEYDSFGVSGEPGIMTAPASSHTPKIVIRRLTSSFTEGNNADGHFDSTDYVNPKYTTSNQKTPTVLPKGAALLHQFDVLAIVKTWAPSTVAGGGKATNHGFALMGYNDSSQNWSAWSREHGNASERPVLTITYTLGPTIPGAPQNMVPSGAVATLTEFEGDFTDPRVTDTLKTTSIEVFDNGRAANVATNDLTTLTGHKLTAGALVYFSAVGTSNLTAMSPYYVIASGLTANAFKVSTAAGGAAFNVTTASAVTVTLRSTSFSRNATNSEAVAAHFIVPTQGNIAISAGVAYRWRARLTDNEGQVSPWSGLVSFNLTDTQPNPPTLAPISGSSYASLNLVKFQGGTFSDPDSGDKLQGHQVQLSPYASGDLRWDEGDGVLWDSGQTYDSLGGTSWTELYGGRPLVAGTYYWRARQWDTRGGVSNWSYATITLTADFNPDPANYDAVQVNPKAPWRVLIRNLFQADGVTPTVGRGPGQLVAVFEEAKNIGASIVFNSPGELHFTLLKDDQQLAAVQPKQTHYAVEFYSGDGWQEKYAGVIWDVDATETDVVFKGIDYLALYDTIIDERYDPLKPNKSYKSNGSYYEKVTIRNIVIDQLNLAKKLADSWVGFIAIGSIATMNEKVSVYSTMQPTLSFISGLLDSHRQGQGIRTRMKVAKTTTGTYQLQIIDAPGVVRADLGLYYGELVQGYRIIIFGEQWANVQLVVGRNRDGVKVVYQTIKGKPWQPASSVYGRIATVAVMDGVEDQADLTRRGLQASIQSAKLGKNIAIGIRTKYLQPLQGWDVCDVFPVKILDGAVNTDAYGSGYWAAYACAWEATDIGQQSCIITLLPREDATAPDANLIPSVPVSPQPEWQLGWTPPDPLKATSLYWLDQSTGKVYKRDDATATLVAVTGTA